MLNLLSTVIGIVFVMLLFSMLASTVMELLAGFLSLRGQQLVKAIQGMVGHETCDDFIKHPFFQQLATGSSERTRVKGKKGRCRRTSVQALLVLSCSISWQ